MRQRYVGTTGLKVSRLGLGTLTWGTDTDLHEAEDQLRVFLDAGGTLLDTEGVPQGYPFIFNFLPYFADEEPAR